MAKILLVINLFLLFFIWSCTVISFGKLPAIISVHFGLDGRADGFGNRNTIWFLCGAATCVFLMLNFVSKKPYSPPLKIPNSLRQNSSLMQIFCQIILLFCMFIFGQLTYITILAALGNYVKLMMDLDITIVAMVLFMVAFFIYAKRLNLHKNAKDL